MDKATPTNAVYESTGHKCDTCGEQATMRANSFMEIPHEAWMEYALYGNPHYGCDAHKPHSTVYDVYGRAIGEK